MDWDIRDGNNIISMTITVKFSFGTHYYENNGRLIMCWALCVNTSTISKVLFYVPNIKRNEISYIFRL